MNIRTLEARLRRVEVGRRPEPKAWVDRYLQIHADSGLPHDERERLRSIVATPAEREWFHRAILALSTDPVHEPWRLLEQSSDAIRRLGEVWRSGGPNQAREAWRVVVEYERTILPLLNEYLASKGRPALPSEQEDRDLARYWSLAPAHGPGLKLVLPSRRSSMAGRCRPDADPCEPDGFREGAPFGDAGQAQS